MSGERNTVFSHQYLFEGEDRQNLLKRPEKLFEAGPFCTRMEDIYQLGNTPSGREAISMLYEIPRQDVFRGPCSRILSARRADRTAGVFRPDRTEAGGISLRCLCSGLDGLHSAAGKS